MAERPNSCLPYLHNAETEMRWATEAMKECKWRQATSHLAFAQIYMEMATEWVKSERAI